jgi:hypothetical protein
MTKIPIFTADQAIAALRQSVHDKAANFYAMYSSVLGGIVTDPAYMVLPLDDHMVHRGHAVFDTATLIHGQLYQLDAHLNRLIQSAGGARIPLPFPWERLRQIILETAAASRQRDGSVRYWLSAGQRLCPRSGGMCRQQLLRHRLQAGGVSGELLQRWHQTNHEPGTDQTADLRSHQVHQLFAQRARRPGSQRPRRR